MKKLIIGVFSFIILIFILAYGVLFTQPGNNLLKPTVESKINKALKTNMKLEEFSMRPSYVFLKLKTVKGSIFTVKGKFSLFSKNLNLEYNLDVNKDEDKLKFDNFIIKGPFWAKGLIKGSANSTLILGKSNFADSNIEYEIKLKNNKPSSVLINIDKLWLKKLLEVLNKPAVADAKIKANINLSSFEKNALKGNGIINITDGTLNRETIKKLFNINLPNTQFKAKATVNLDGSIVKFDANLDSNIAKSKIIGTFNQKSENIKAKYKLDINRLSLLKPIININLKGRFSTDGVANGTKNLLTIKGKSNIADSNTHYEIELTNFKAKNINITSQNAKLDKVLALFDKPKYAFGTINTSLTITNLEKLSGKLNLSINKGTINATVVNKLLKTKVPQTSFKANVLSIIKDDIANSKITINSSIASIKAKKCIFNIKELSFDSDYLLKIPNLDKLYFLVGRHLSGSTIANGNIHFSNGNIKADASSKMWNGELKINLVNNDITGKAKGVSMVKIMEMMRYKKIFDSKGDIDFKYNLFTKKGTAHAIFKDGHILPTRFTALLYGITRFDITRELYKTTTIDTKIDNKKLYTNLDMVSKRTRISSKNALIDLNRDYIDAKVKVEIKKKHVYVKLKGNLKHPKIKINASDLIKQQLEKKAGKLLEKMFR
ncbi:hypothetical protein [Hippea alviniae]|uniref:hypothetical protein n=1 Tax=Hippea alviniae TaxID=1279027 RepID=UPI0003B6B044|nr:hypothetical protein [Hippea alviniae]